MGALITGSGEVFFVDPDVWQWARHKNWYLKRGYVCRYEGVNGEEQEICLHQELMGTWGLGRLVHVHHVDDDRMNNRRENLKVLSAAEHRRCREPGTANLMAPRGASGIKGVTWNKRSKRWQVALRHEGRNLFFGVYKDAEEAALVYDSAVLHYRGGAGYLNFL